MTKIIVPFLDMVGLHAGMEEELVDVMRKAISSGRFIGGEEVESFEREFASYIGTRYCVAVSSGTDALRFALMASGIMPRTIMITVPNTFIATAEAISQAGGQVMFVDIDPLTYDMSPLALERFLETECTRDPTGGHIVHAISGRPVSAVVPVHLYGQPADMDAINAIACRFGLQVFEDACQSHGSDYYSKKLGQWQRTGTIGRAAAFSFYPGKNLGALGEGGAVTTDDEELAERVKILREHGSKIKYYHNVEGYNGRLDAIQAGFLRCKLPHLDAWNDHRREAAKIYTKELESIAEILTPFESDSSRSNYHLYIIQTEKRDELRNFLESNGIGTGLHYPLPLHLQKAYSELGIPQGSFPASETAAHRILSLPMFPGITRQQQQIVIDCIRRYFSDDTSSAPTTEADHATASRS